MKRLALAGALSSMLALSSFAQAREINFTTVINNYKGEGVYLALYLVDKDGRYQRTLWVAGKKTKYYKHLSEWARGSHLKKSEYDGLTGASVLSRQSLMVSSDIPDEMIDAGFEVRIDTAVEDLKDNRADVSIPLTTAGAGKSVPGHGYVASFSYTL